jgi:hypothetical protein
MFSTQPAELLFPSPLRCCASVPASRSSARYLVGTAVAPGGGGEGGGLEGSSGGNRVHLLRYHEEANEVGVDATLDHPTGEVWCVASCPTDGGVVVTCGGGGGGGATTKVWRIPADLLGREDDLDDLDDSGDGLGVGPPPPPGADLAEMEGTATLLVDAAEGDPTGGRMSAALFRPAGGMGWDDDDDDDHFGDGGGGGGDLLTVAAFDGALTRWDLNAGAAEVGRIEGGAGGGGTRRAAPGGYRAAWDPHHPHTVAVAGPRGLGSGGGGGTVVLHDLRSSSGGGGCLSPGGDGGSLTGPLGLGRGGGGVTDVSFNPNLPHVLCTAGTDGLVRFWDLRSTSSSPSSRRPLKVLRGGHQHWSDRVEYNPHHDQLVLSGGSDGVVNLWRAGSVSSAPMMDLDLDDNDQLDDEAADAPMAANGDDENAGVHGMDGDRDGDGNTDGSAKEGADVRVASRDLPDAVYGLTWSAADPWTYLAVGYDGTVSVNHVPSREKYKILL